MATLRRPWLIVLLLALASHLRAQPASLIHFELQDQFDHRYSDASFRGKPLLLIICDRSSGRFGPAWGRALDAHLGSNWRARTSVVPVAQMPGLPRFLRGFAKGRFPHQSDQAVLLDWDNVLSKAYGFHPGNCNLFVFDAAGRLLQRAYGREPDAAHTQQVADAILNSLGATPTSQASAK